MVKHYNSNPNSLTKPNLFISSISHEIRNRLAPIIYISQMLKMHQFDNNHQSKTEYLENINILNEATNEALSLVDDLMDMNQSCYGEFNINLQPLKIDQIITIIQRSIKLNQGFALKQNIQICLNHPNIASEKHEAINLDPKRFKQIIINLISNAIKYSHPKTKVTIDLNFNQIGNLNISIKDSGIGMSQEHIDMALNGQGAKIEKDILLKNNSTTTKHHHIRAISGAQRPNNQEQTNHQKTHPEQQTPNPLNDSHGIGLPLVQKLVKAQGGSMDIKSQLGRGCEIVLGL
jgi:signal transduction histidine kinase